jgi:hypothetical protein
MATPSGAAQSGSGVPPLLGRTRSCKSPTDVILIQSVMSELSGWGESCPFKDKNVSNPSFVRRPCDVAQTFLSAVPQVFKPAGPTGKLKFHGKFCNRHQPIAPDGGGKLLYGTGLAVIFRQASIECRPFSLGSPVNP